MGENYCSGRRWSKQIGGRQGRDQKLAAFVEMSSKGDGGNGHGRTERKRPGKRRRPIEGRAIEERRPLLVTWNCPALPYYFALKIVLTKNLIQNRFKVMPFAPIPMDVNRTIAGQKILDEHEPLSQEFDELCASNFVLLSLLLLVTLKFPFR